MHTEERPQDCRARARDQIPKALGGANAPSGEESGSVRLSGDNRRSPLVGEGGRLSFDSKTVFYASLFLFSGRAILKPWVRAVQRWA